MGFNSGFKGLRIVIQILHEIIKVYSPTDAQSNSLKSNYKFCIKININPYPANVKNMVSS